MPRKQDYHHHENKDCRYKKAPKGHFVVYVGKELKRFVIPISYLKNSKFQLLLENAAEEYGFDNTNGIVLPCDESTFHELIAFLAKN
ncbi:Small auxin-up RNA [Parasponia andersonii]|uniref:Small auxin-up RNA n=1 Tax=Parasponia andersonii TaxID=3476 RepID=A0A2P5AEX6_PARAD|nr:Small auxin-up RNA [Parasponia andersonii]